MCLQSIKTPLYFQMNLCKTINTECCVNCTFNRQCVRELTRTELYKQGKVEISTKREGWITSLDRAAPSWTGHLNYFIASWLHILDDDLKHCTKINSFFTSLLTKPQIIWMKHQKNKRCICICNTGKPQVQHYLRKTGLETRCIFTGLPIIQMKECQ